MERRTLQSSRPRLARSADGKPKIQGYAAVFYNATDPGTESELARHGDYRVVERLLPSAFDRAVKEDDVRALFNHDPSLILGRSSSHTLRLSIDGKGLRYEIDPPDTQTARDLIESLKRGDVTGSSFSFDYLAKDVIQKSESDGSETDVIEVRETRLYDVGPVTFPAYASSTSGYRSAAEVRAAIRACQRWTPAMMRRRVEEIEAELAEMNRRDAHQPVSQRTRRERRRDRMHRRLDEIAIDELDGVVEEARKIINAACLRRTGGSIYSP